MEGSHLCHAKGCTKQGRIRTLIDTRYRGVWVYRMCDEHYYLLDERDLSYIARKEGARRETRE